MDRLTTSRLARANADRLKHVDAVKSYDLELGRLAKAAIDADEYTTQSAVARVLGVSHTHVRNLIDAAEAAGTELAGDADRAVGIPMLANELAGEYVQSRGARILRSISGFREPDVLVDQGWTRTAAVRRRSRRLDPIEPDSAVQDEESVSCLG